MLAAADVNMLILAFLIQVFLQWVVLMIVIPLTQKLAEFSMPPWGEAMWKLAVTALAMTGAATLVGALIPSGLISWAVSTIVLWILLAKWLDVDGLGIWIIMIASVVVNVFLTILILGAMGL